MSIWCNKLDEHRETQIEGEFRATLLMQIRHRYCTKQDTKSFKDTLISKNIQ